MQNIIKRVIRILVSGYIVKMIRNLIFKNSNDSNKTITNRNIKTELISNSVFILSVAKNILFVLLCTRQLLNLSNYIFGTFLLFSSFLIY